jgi:hypothetical protein
MRLDRAGGISATIASAAMMSQAQPMVTDRRIGRCELKVVGADLKTQSECYSRGEGPAI